MKKMIPNGLLILVGIGLWLLAGCSKHPEDDHAIESESGEIAAQQAQAHEEHGEEELVVLSEEERSEFDIQVATAGPGTLRDQLALPGEVVFNPDAVVHVAPRVPGVVLQVFKKVGDKVARGDVLAVLESRELATLKADYLGTLALEKLTRSNYEREEKLHSQKISSQRSYFEARQKFEETGIQRKKTERALHAVGVSEAELERIGEKGEVNFAVYELLSPLDGVVVERHLVRGELVGSDATQAPFVVADLQNVWVQLTVYQKDLMRVRPGMEVRVECGHEIPHVNGRIEYVTPSLQESTRTATARVVLSNPEMQFRPGLFVTGNVLLPEKAVDVVVPKSAILEFEGRSVVFVEDEEGFHPAAIETGKDAGGEVEILSGLEPGQRYAAKNGLTIKAQLLKGEMGDGHAH